MTERVRGGRGLSNVGLTAIAIVFSALLALLIDLVASQFGWFDLLTDPALRMTNLVTHHSLTPGMCTWAKWGPMRHRECTNSAGFKDATNRQVPLTGTKPRVLFIGDSFTEAVGLSWEASYVGQFAADHPELEVLNAGLASYSPTVYFSRIRELLKQGYRFDHLVVAIDISDIQDETWYHLDEATGYVTDARDPPRTAWQRWWEVLMKRNFKATYTVYREIEANFQVQPPEDLTRWARATWTFEDWDKLAPDYQPIGVAAAVERARTMMDRLYAELRPYDISLSVMVYPWESQMRYDRVDSLQVRMWRDWCEGKCKHFIDQFQPFFAYKAAHPETWGGDLYIYDDVHFTPAANRLLADRLKEVSWP